LTTTLLTTAKKSAAFARAATLSLTLAAFSWGAWAHGGEDHGEAAPAVVSATMAPRATAQTEDFELVAQMQGTTMTLTLDRFATNAPVLDAQIEVESGTNLKAMAKPIAPGVYALQAPLLATPGSYPLTFSVQAGDTTDLMAATLDIAASSAVAVHGRGWGEWATWGVAAAALVFGMVLVVLRQRKRARRDGN
jgi:hypothetical protein